MHNQFHAWILDNKQNSISKELISTIEFIHTKINTNTYLYLEYYPPNPFRGVIHHPTIGIYCRFHPQARLCDHMSEVQLMISISHSIPTHNTQITSKSRELPGFLLGSREKSYGGSHNLQTTMINYSWNISVNYYYTQLLLSCTNSN